MYASQIREADLLLQLKNYKSQLEAFRSGEKYTRMQEEHRKELAVKDRRIRKLEQDLASSNAAIVDVRNIWMQAAEDLIKETKAELAAMRKQLAKEKGEKFKAQRQRDEMKDRLRDKNRELYEAKGQLEEKQEEIGGLMAQINKDYTNSGKSSSLSPNHAKIHNGREATGKKPGGQPGHAGHKRQAHTPDRVIHLPAPEEFLDTTRYRPAGRKVCRQLVKMSVTLDVTQWEAEEFICIATGKPVYAAFPEGVANDVNYDGTVKALPYILNNKCNVSIANTKAFMEAVSGGKLKLSTGMICGLSREFSQKTREERSEIFLKLLASPVMNADFTFGRVNGKTGAVIVCTADGQFLYQGREKKGHEGVKGSPAEYYKNTLVSDHESTFHHYGARHQECLVHVERYLRSSMENEPGREWSGEMLEWVKEAIHYRNGAVRDGIELDEGKVAELEKKYDEILGKAAEEYADVPPSEYYREGYNTSVRMAKDRDDYLLFLHDKQVPPTNNAAENAARKFKRKAAQVMCFRSMDGHNYYCDGLSIMATMEAQGENLLEGVAKRFNLTARD